MPPVILGPRCNHRATCDSSPNNARSESALAINPLDPYNIVGSAKRFSNPAIYGFTLAAHASFDGGQSWTEAPPLALLAGWAGSSDPAVAWDNAGNAYLLALPFGPGTATDFTGNTVGIAVYKSTDGGRSWGLPNLIHSSGGDDKQWITGDTSPTSPHYGNVYAAWDDGATLRFARTTDHGASWIGTGASAAGSALASDSFSPEISVAPNGAVYIVWLNGQSGSQIKYVKSTDGGNSFSAPQVAATGITSLRGHLPETAGWPHFPNATFRVLTLATGCTGTGNNVVFAWADFREGISRIYYRRSGNGGTTWQGPTSGQPLLTGAVASAPGMQDFHPQLIATPDGEIGCAFYEFGPTGGGEFPPNLINVILAVSTNSGTSFPNRVTVTEHAWDPTIDAPFVHGNPAVTFIGEYFGLDASRLGFFLLWTDTRTGVQELFSARVAVRPADVYIRDSGSDIGRLPSPGFHWEAVDLVVRRQPDGNTHFVNQDLLRDGVTNHYVYGRVHNAGPNNARNVGLAVMVANYPSLNALPGTEFRYPQDWYEKDWAFFDPNKHLFLGTSTPVNISNGGTRIIGPVLWPAAQIPDPAHWHPCLLAEVRTDNDDSADTTPGSVGCGIDADPSTCVAGSFFWGNNNICQRNLSYAPVLLASAAFIELPFVIGSVWSTAKRLEVIVDKGRELALTPMSLRIEPLDSKPPGQKCCDPADLVLVDGGRVIVRVDSCDVGEIIAAPGTIWRTRCCKPEHGKDDDAGGKDGRTWPLPHPRSSVAVAVGEGELRKATLSFTVPTDLKPGTRTLVRIYQRNDGGLITGSVILELQVGAASARTQRATRTAAATRPKRARTVRGKRR
jgi:hypothetical protein